MDSTNRTDTGAVVTLEASGSTDITLAAAMAENPSILSSSAEMPLTPIPPHPPLASAASTHPPRPPLMPPHPSLNRSRSAVSSLLKERKPSRQVGPNQASQRGERLPTKSAVKSSANQHHSLAIHASRSHPQPTRHRSKGKGASTQGETAGRQSPALFYVHKHNHSFPAYLHCTPRP